MKFEQLAFLLAVTPAFTQPAPAAAADYPLTLENCGSEVTFDAPPERVVTVGQSATEMLYALGLSDAVVGTSVWFNDIPGEFAEENADVPRLADNEPSLESVVAKHPQLVVAQFGSQVGVQGTVSTREQLHELGIQTYVMPADCLGKDNRAGDGVRSTDFSVGTVYQAVEELATIFNVEERGEALSAKLRGRQEEAMADATALALGDVTGVFWFSSAQDGSDPFVAGQRGIPAFMMNALGMRNVIESDEEWPTVGWETIARADPDVIMIARMDRRRYAADNHEKKIAFLRSDPVTSQMTAVKEGRIVVVDAHAVHASVRMFDGMETIVEALEASTLLQ
ncbi:ABC transporter substrate-binding protein [Chelativorans sp. YIM 93263]|uniref:ABC transporter substrate-binding protein n=1 Tax=Chelativorans sp. YIM 93263 TaxID=2906648 RepID=UPI00237811C9|nr:ABC transporter substrate-binding protein [Chelativorans sp. YIM 93263]